MCSAADRDDVTKPGCYCHFHTSSICFNSAGEGQADEGGSTGATINTDNSCVDSTDQTCRKETPIVIELSGSTDVHMRDTRSSGNVHDDVNVTIVAEVGRCGDVVIVREATAVVLDDGVVVADVSTYFRLMFSTVVEFGDANDNGRLDDNDDIRTILNISSLACSIKTSSSIINGAQCYTVAVYDSTAILTLTFTVCSASLTIGSRSVPARSAFEILEIQWPYSASDSKLAIFFDVFTLSVEDTFEWISSSSSLALNNAAGLNKGSLTFDLTARSGSNDNIPLNFDLQSVSISTVAALAIERTAFRLIVSIDAFAPYPLILDPVYSGGNQESTQSATTSSAVTFRVIPFIAILLSMTTVFMGL